MRMVEVVWNDAQDHPDTWVDKEDAEGFNDKECKVRSVGYVIKEGPKYLTIGSDWDEDDQNYGTVRKIAKGMIVSIREVILLPVQEESH